MRTEDTVKRVIAALPIDDVSIPIYVDDTGLGGGVTDGLLALGYNAIGINFQQSANDPDRYVNAISEMWFNLAMHIDEYSLPYDEELLEELTNRAETLRDNRGRRRVEPKEIFKAKMGRSPDKADSLMLACYDVSNVGEAIGTLSHSIY